MSNNPYRQYISKQWLTPPEDVGAPQPVIQSQSVHEADDDDDDEQLRLEEEELRTRLRLIELRKKRRNSPNAVVVKSEVPVVLTSSSPPLASPSWTSPEIGSSSGWSQTNSTYTDDSYGLSPKSRSTHSSIIQHALQGPSQTDIHAMTIDADHAVGESNSESHTSRDVSEPSPSLTKPDRSPLSSSTLLTPAESDQRLRQAIPRRPVTSASQLQGVIRRKSINTGRNVSYSNPGDTKKYQATTEDEIAGTDPTVDKHFSSASGMKPGCKSLGDDAGETSSQLHTWLYEMASDPEHKSWLDIATSSDRSSRHDGSGATIPVMNTGTGVVDTLRQKVPMGVSSPPSGYGDGDSPRTQISDTPSPVFNQPIPVSLQHQGQALVTDPADRADDPGDKPARAFSFEGAAKEVITKPIDLPTRNHRSTAVSAMSFTDREGMSLSMSRPVSPIAGWSPGPMPKGPVSMASNVESVPDGPVSSIGDWDISLEVPRTRSKAAGGLLQDRPNHDELHSSIVAQDHDHSSVGSLTVDDTDQDEAPLSPPVPRHHGLDDPVDPAVRRTTSPGLPPSPTRSQDTNMAFEEDETCNCGRARPSKDECFFCWPCNGTVFCKNCWDKCPPHKQQRHGRRRNFGLPHEKSNPGVARKIFETLQSERNLEQQTLLHVQDEDASWFGTGKDMDSGDMVFQDFGRYPRLMEMHSSARRRTKFPALVSFVGQTGAGKSSLIRLLIESLAPVNAVPQVPVVGSTLHADLPTSGDVHLYPDLSTFESDQPILYADCEGLDGGERKPMGARRDKKSNDENHRTTSFTKHLRKQHHTCEREIMWADTPSKMSRDYHVRHLYPRLLFTFSDVVVFVMKNPRVIENTIEQLINWAAAALETSSNQPSLPHAIIVLNAFDNASDPNLWDVDASTIDLMERVSRAVHQNHNMRKFAEFWRERGRQIETVETLLLSYYSSVRVVRVVGHLFGISCNADMFS